MDINNGAFEMDWSPTHREVMSIHKCVQCDGDGVTIDAYDDVKVCEKCKGYGKLTDCGNPYKDGALVLHPNAIDYTVMSSHKCKQCDGDGVTIDAYDEDDDVKVCEKCKGTGFNTGYGQPIRIGFGPREYEVVTAGDDLEVSVADETYTDGSGKEEPLMSIWKKGRYKTNVKWVAQELFNGGVEQLLEGLEPEDQAVKDDIVDMMSQLASDLKDKLK